MPIRPQDVYDDPDGHWDFLTTPSDRDFEGQHFDRKEGRRPRPDGSVSGTDIQSFRSQIVECVSGFANANRDGGLLVVGIASDGAVRGLKHLNENQINQIMKLDDVLVSHGCHCKLHQGCLRRTASRTRLPSFSLHMRNTPYARPWVRIRAHGSVAALRTFPCPACTGNRSNGTRASSTSNALHAPHMSKTILMQASSKNSGKCSSTRHRTSGRITICFATLEPFPAIGDSRMPESCSSARTLSASYPRHISACFASMYLWNAGKTDLPPASTDPFMGRLPSRYGIFVPS